MSVHLSEQNLDDAHVGVALQQMRCEACRSVWGETQAPSPATSAAMWQARLNCRVVMGRNGSRRRLSTISRMENAPSRTERRGSPQAGFFWPRDGSRRSGGRELFVD
jgi:hypothetical protein